MFKTFFLAEIKHAFKQPMIYIFLVILGLLVFGATVFDNVTIGGSTGNIHKNAPHVITIYTSIMSIFGLLMATAFFNTSALKDYDNNFNEILFSTPLSKAGYYFGRFFGALFLATIPMIGVFLGIIIGSFLGPVFGWIDADMVGSFTIKPYINNYFLFVLPNMFFAGAIIFALANKWRSPVVSFVGTLIIIITYFVSGSLLSDIDNETLAALLDSFGIRTYMVSSKYFTPIEKNTLSPEFSGILLLNRLLWLGIGVIFLIISYFTFSFKEKNKKVKLEKNKTKIGENDFSNPTLNPSFNKNTSWIQFKSFFKMNLLSITKSATFKILFLFSAILLITKLIGGFEHFGLQSYPLTYKMIEAISGKTAMFVIIILVFFSGELIWRDRNNKINEVIDATPHTAFISLFSKALSLVTITLILHLFFVFCTISYQIINGFSRIELSLYLQDFLQGDLLMYFIWSGVMIMIQVLVNNKYLGYFVSILFIFLSAAVFSALDIESNMLYVGSKPSLMYSDMNGFGPGLEAAIWFNAYWILFSFLCLLIAASLWNRGTNSSLMSRIIYAKKAIPRSHKNLIIGTFIAWIAVAGNVFYNTQRINPYATSNEQEETAIAYEKKYKKYELALKPKIVDVKYNIDIFPYKRDLYAMATMQITNPNAMAIDSIHFNLNSKWNPEIMIPNAKIVLDDKELDYRIFHLSKPLLPNDTITIEIKTSHVSEGFKNERGNTSIINNGTFVGSFEILPTFGYNPDVEISDKNTRKKHDLAPKERMPALADPCDHRCNDNYISNGESDFITIETTISTVADQIAIAPGSLIKEWKKEGRNYYHYKVDHPSLHFCSFVSAKFEVKKRKWNGVDIEVYYDKKHDTNIEMMIDAVERSLDYYTKNFGPYYHKQCRIIEFPRYATFAQAFPGTMPYSESFGFTTNLEDENEINVIDAVIAHEMAHQWWAHQVIGGNMQGGTMMSESFAEYSSLMVMKKSNNDAMKMRKFLKYDHDRYLRGRSGETKKELALYKVENQQYIHYGKGSVLLYALQDYIGEENLNTAMRNFLNEYKYSTPYPSSLDFIKHLEPIVPDSLNYLIEDWFKSITLYDNRLTDATYKKLQNGRYEVSMNTETYKIKADSIGNETIVPMDDWIDIGVFADNKEENLLYIKRVKINQEKMNFTFEVDTIPAKASIDPKRLLIDRIYKDNRKVMVEEEL